MGSKIFLVGKKKMSIFINKKHGILCQLKILSKLSIYKLQVLFY